MCLGYPNILHAVAPTGYLSGQVAREYGCAIQCCSECGVRLAFFAAILWYACLCHNSSSLLDHDFSYYGNYAVILLLQRKRHRIVGLARHITVSYIFGAYTIQQTCYSILDRMYTSTIYTQFSWSRYRRECPMIRLPRILFWSYYNRNARALHVQTPRTHHRWR